MTRHLTQITNDAFRESYKNQYGFYPSMLGAAFGWASQQTVYHIFDGLTSFGDDMLGNVPLIGGSLQDIFTGICGAVYGLIARWAYSDWANQGDQVTKQFEQVIADYEAKLKALTDSAQTQLDQLNGLIDQAKKTLQDHGVRIDQLEQKLSALNILDLSKLIGKLP